MAKLFGKNYSKKELLDKMGNIGTLAGVRTIEYQDGFARGLRAYEVVCGDIRFTAYIDKCLDIGEYYYKGVPLHYHARPGVMNGSWFYDGENAPRSIMCGMLFTCGLTNVGPIQQLPDGKTLPQHGFIRNTPAEHCGARCYWEGDDYFIELTGTMRESSLFGTNLVLRRTITCKLGENAIHIHDEIENESSTENVPLTVMYHCNAGFPLLDADSRLVIDPEKTGERDEIARIGRRQESPLVFGEPVVGYDEQVFYNVLRADAAGMCHATMVNPGRRLSLTVSYSKKELPNLIHWKCKDAGNYVTGIEPSNCYPEGLARERAGGTLRLLAAHELVENELCLSVCDGEAAMAYLK